MLIIDNQIVVVCKFWSVLYQKFTFACNMAINTRYQFYSNFTPCSMYCMFKAKTLQINSYSTPYSSNSSQGKVEVRMAVTK